MIRIEMAGFAPVTVVRDKTINGWFWVNVCFGGDTELPLPLEDLAPAR